MPGTEEACVGRPDLWSNLGVLTGAPTGYTGRSPLAIFKLTC